MLSVHSTAARAKHAAKASYTLRHAHRAHRRHAGQPLCVVHGNCQAEPIRALLAGSAVFAGEYKAVRVPGVHEIGAAQLARFQTILKAASVIIVQQIKNNYRGLPLGTDQVAGFASPRCTVIRFQALHYDAYYPFQFNVLGDDLLSVPGPITVYHDLRTVCAAAKGLSDDDAVRWVGQHRPSENALRAVAAQAEAQIRDRERSTDISVVDSIVAPPRTAVPSFFTVNHPSSSVFQRIVDTIHEFLGLRRGHDATGGREPLGRFRTPLEQPVIDALGLAYEPAPFWTINGKRVPTDEVIRFHLAWYRRRPDVVEAALRAHAHRIQAFGLI